MKGGVRGIAFIAAVLAHVGLVMLLMAPARRDVGKPVDSSRMVVVFIESQARSAMSGVPLRISEPTLLSPAPVVILKLPRIDSSGTAITVPPDVAREATPSSPSVDWQQETRTAAARLAESLETERRRKGKFTPDPRFARAAPRPQFGWDQSKTHRIESLPEGGTLIHLNDRCVVVLSGFLFPICKLGKVPARGDLFEHMGDAPTSDDEP